MKRLILLYVTAWLIPIALYVHVWYVEAGDAASGEQSGLADYVLYLCATVVTLLVSYAAVKFFAFSFVKDKLSGKEGLPYARSHVSLSMLRLCMVLFAEVLDVAVLLVAGEQSVLYLMAILVLVLFFCLPTSCQGREPSLPPADK